MAKSMLGLLHRAFAAGRTRDQGALEELEQEVVPAEEGERGDLSQREPPPLETSRSGPNDDHIHIHLPQRREDTMAKDEGFGGGGMNTGSATRSRFTDPGEGGEAPPAETGGGGGGVEAVLQAMMQQHEKMLAALDAICGKLGCGANGGAPAPPAEAGDRRARDEDPDTGLEGPLELSRENAEGEHDIPGNLEMEAPTGTTSDHIRKARDSALLSASFQETLQGAEILAPGINLPRFDVKASPKKTYDCMCDLRRDALELARNTPEMRRTIEELTDGQPIARLQTRDLRTVFKAAAMYRAQLNNGSVRGEHRNPALQGYGGGTGVRSRIKTPAEMNAANREYWKRQGGVGR